MRKQALISLIILLLLSGCKINEQVYKEKGFAERVKFVGIDNLAQINPSLYRGAQPTKKGFVNLKKLGVKTIINLRSSHSDENECKGFGFKYYHIKVNPVKTPESSQIRQFIEIATTPENQPVFFHCQLGKDRTGMMCAIYRILCDGWSNEEALSEMDYFGSNYLFNEFIRGFDKNMLTYGQDK